MNLKKIPKKNKDILFRKERDKIVMLHEVNGTPYYLEKVASFIWNQIDGKKSLGEILVVLESRYDESHKIIKKDFLDFIDELKDNDLIRIDDES